MLQLAEPNSALLPIQASAAAAKKPRKRPLQESSKVAYAKDLALFIRTGGTVPCTPAAVLRYVEVMRTRLAARTLRRRLWAIAHAHKAAGHPSPLDDPKVRVVLRWLAAGKLPPKSGKAPDPGLPPPQAGAARRAKPITRDLLNRILDAVHRTSLDRRDRALLLMAFSGALKRSEVVAINVDDLRWTTDALIVTIGHGEDTRARKLAIPITGGELCAATAVRALVDHLQLEPGTGLFRSFDRAGDPTSKRLGGAFVNEVLKARMRVVGLDPTGYSGESLRTGRRQELAKGVL